MKENKVAVDLFNAINDYLQESSKKEYIFSLEEQLNLQRAIAILNNQIAMLVDYEVKKNK